MKRKHWIIAALIAIAAGLMLYICGSGPSGPDNATADEREKQSRLFNVFQFISGEKEESPAQEFDPSNINKYEISQANLIRDIIIEKNPVCVNEDFMVTVVAKNPNGPDEHLVYRIQNKLGNPVILRYTKAGRREFYVTVRDEGKHIDLKKVEVTVLDCPGRSAVTLTARLHKLKSETAQFEVINQEGLAGKCTYQWDFGDGNRATTDTGYAEHSYAARDQKTLQSSFLVKVKVTDSMQQTATGRTAVSFPNIHYLSRLMGSAILPVMYDHFPKVTESGIEVQATFKNIFDEPLTFDTADVELKPCSSSLSPEHRQLAASSVLDTATINPGASVQQAVRLSGSVLPPSTCNVTIHLKGYFAGNEEGGAKLYLDIPPRTKKDVDVQKDRVVEDNEMIRKLNKAAQILGKGRPITPADIEKLDREGKL